MGNPNTYESNEKVYFPTRIPNNSEGLPYISNGIPFPFKADQKPYADNVPSFLIRVSLFTDVSVFLIYIYIYIYIYLFICGSVYVL